MDKPKVFRKKPVVIEAFQWDGTVEKATLIINWILENDGVARYVDYDGEETYIAIDTLEGTMQLKPNSYAIKGVQHEFYPCKPDIFITTYEDWA